ncbi:MAG TPA: hypothetical protein VEK39_08290, partial [Solirubrobacterales bacterium]|nr:hypothetical protein [Solirubrobacterales bacterium]
MTNRITHAQLERALRLPADDAAAARAAERATQRAAEEGLADVAYATTDSPVGPLLIARTRRGLVRIAFSKESPETVLNDLVVKISPRVLEAPAQLDEVRHELEQYFEGRRREFDLPLDWRL